MNFDQIIEVTKRETGHVPPTPLDMAICSFTEKMNEMNVPDWRSVKLKQGDTYMIYEDLREELQFVGMALMIGKDDFDTLIFDDLTTLLAALRKALTQNFQVELPEVKIVPLTDEMAALGVLEIFEDEKGQKLVKPRENIYDLRIKIIKTPVGPAPEEFKQKWLDCRALPAYRRPREAGQEKTIAHLLPMDSQQGIYVVPKKPAIEAMREISPEAADWLFNYFGEKGTLFFRLDEAEIVATKQKSTKSKPKEV